MEAQGNYDIDKIHNYEINGLPVESGDLICTVDGNPSFVIGQFWWIVGKLIPGDVDHIVVYVGPEGRCVESGAQGKVITFNVPDKRWDAQAMFEKRGFVDEFYGVAYPIAGRGLSSVEIQNIRLDVTNYCLRQARENKPYNLNFYDSDTEDAFYCSQLAYKAYLHHNINLNTEKGIPNILLSKSIVFPQEVWSACHRKEIYKS